MDRSSLKASLSFRLVAAFLAVAAAGFALVTLAGRAGEPVAFVKPVVATAQVTDDPDDPAIWVNRSDPARSLISAPTR